MGAVYSELALAVLIFCLLHSILFVHTYILDATLRCNIGVGNVDHDNEGIDHRGLHWGSTAALLEC